jgi:hypothetical protein
MDPAAGRPLTEYLLAAIHDGKDRIALAWPARPGGGFVVTAVALREAHASGRLSHATVGFWPWRKGVTSAARSILVNPIDVAQAATRAVNEISHGAAWVLPGLSHQSLCMLEMRLRDLRSTAAKVVVRSPTLLETTRVFPPGEDRRRIAYSSEPEQVLRRVREYTHMGDKNAGLEDHLLAVGDPLSTPFAVLGIPAAATPEALARYIAYPRVANLGLDVVVADLTSTGRSKLPDDWEPLFSSLLKALDAIAGRRPAVVAIVEDAFAMRRAVRTVKMHSGSLQPKRSLLEVGAYLEQDGILGPAAILPSELPPITFEADIKDASLVPIRKRLVSLGRELRKAGHTTAADGASRVLTFLRRSASLPIGLAEAQMIADILHDGEDEVDTEIRAMFRPKMALAQLAAVADLAPSFGVEAKNLIKTIEEKAAAWVDESPVSAKLARLLAEPEWNSETTLLGMPDRRVADVFLASDRAMSCRCIISDHKGLADRIAATSTQRLVVIGPTPDAVRALLTAEKAPPQVLLLGDAAGSALLAAEVAPLERISAFSSVAARAKAFSSALRRGGGDESLDLSEAEFRVAVTIPEGEIDLTRSDDVYRGDIVRILTQREHRLAYRPGGEVLTFTAGETRPFERVAARNVNKGDSILVLDASVREPIRRAMAGSRQSLRQLAAYHSRIASIRSNMPGQSDADKARLIFSQMKSIDPNIGQHEIPNIKRWLTADLAPGGPDGAKQPRAAQDWRRFGVFMKAIGVETALSTMYWQAAILPARSYRSQEGHAFNQRVVQFVLDPEGTAAGPSAWKAMPELWQLVLESVDEVAAVRIAPAGESDDV